MREVHHLAVGGASGLVEVTQAIAGSVNGEAIAANREWTHVEQLLQLGSRRRELVLVGHVVQSAPLPARHIVPEQLPQAINRLRETVQHDVVSLTTKRAKQLSQYYPAALTEDPAGLFRHVQTEHIRVKTVHPNLVDRRGDGILGKHVVPLMEHAQRAFHVWIGRGKAVEKWNQVARGQRQLVGLHPLPVADPESTPASKR